MTQSPAPDQTNGWKTSHEKAFIDFLSQRKDAQGLLLGYVTGIRKRVAWEQMDRQQVVMYAEWKLDRLTRDQRAS